MLYLRSLLDVEVDAAEAELLGDNLLVTIDVEGVLRDVANRDGLVDDAGDVEEALDEGGVGLGVEALGGSKLDGLAQILVSVHGGPPRGWERVVSSSMNNVHWLQRLVHIISYYIVATFMRLLNYAGICAGIRPLFRNRII